MAESERLLRLNKGEYSGLPNSSLVLKVPYSLHR